MSKTTNKYSPQLRERAVRMVIDNAGQHESRWSAILSISAKIGYAPQTLNEWVKKVEVDTVQRGSVTTEQAEKMKALEREVRELKQAKRSFAASFDFDTPILPLIGRLTSCKSVMWRTREGARQRYSTAMVRPAVLKHKDTVPSNRVARG